MSEGGAEPAAARPLSWPWFKSKASVIETFYVALIAQVAVPLVAFLPEFVRTGTVRPVAIGAGGAIYVLGLACACRTKWAMATCGFIGLAAAAIYGFDPSIHQDATPDQHGTAGRSTVPLILLGFTVIIYTIDRFYRHLILGEKAL